MRVFICARGFNSSPFLQYKVELHQFFIQNTCLIWLMTNTFTGASTSQVVSAEYLLELWHRFCCATSVWRGAARPSLFPLFNLSDWLLTDWGLSLKRSLGIFPHSYLSFDIYHLFKSVLWRADTAGKQTFSWSEQSIRYYHVMSHMAAWV